MWLLMKRVEKNLENSNLIDKNT